MSKTLPECPNCHKSDKVEKVSEIVADGFSTVTEEGTEPFAWAGQTYYIQYKEYPTTEEIASREQNKPGKGIVRTGKTIYTWNALPRKRITLSPLADRLLPRIEKPKAPGDITKVMGCFNIFLWPFLFRRISNWVYKNREADYTQKLLKSEEAQEKWIDLYYCYRCEGVFSKDSAFIPVQQMHNYLFGLEPNHWYKQNTRVK